MAKGQHLSRYQQGIVRRHYEHYDTKLLGRLSEIVSDLAIAGDDKAREKLWKRAAEALAKSGLAQTRIDKVLADRKVEGLAAAVGEMSARKPG